MSDGPRATDVELEIFDLEVPPEPYVLDELETKEVTLEPLKEGELDPDAPF